jgi:uncharacterized membrane protein YphA (DoxX/SURF4 family)
MMGKKLQFTNILSLYKQQRWAQVFTTFTRVLLAIGFITSGLTKLLGNRFTVLGTDTPIGFFFEALYQTGFYWQFIGGCQLLAALLLLIPRIATIGALIYLPIILNIFVVTISLHFRGTPIITGLMLLATIYLLIWDYAKWHGLFRQNSVVDREVAIS